MVQDVTIPLSWANNIPGVSGVEDVQFSIPEVEDLVAGVEDALPTGQDIRDILRDEIPDLLRDVDVFDGELDVALQPIIDELDDRLDDLVDDIQDEIDRAVADLDIPALEDIEVDVGGSLFAVNEDFVDLLAAALDQADLVDVGQFPTVEEIVQPIEDVRSDIEALDIPETEELADEVVDRVADALQEFPGGDLLADPDQFIDDQIDRVTDGLVSEDVRQDLQDALEER